MDYRLLATEPKTPFRLVPTVLIVATAATAISAAMRPYSIAVAPLSSRRTAANGERFSKERMDFIGYSGEWVATTRLFFVPIKIR